MKEQTPAVRARVSMYSPWYSYRLFRDYTGTAGLYQAAHRL
ncbi:hypothetical protein [Oscillibacter valericigenes]|nr:hypothetical protein [Oscillibacter valericigenes]